MITAISQKITSFLMQENSIQESDAEIYQYGIEITISSILNVALILLVSIITKTMISGIMFFSVFVILRQFTGGYHASTYFRCNAVLVVTYITVLLLSRYVVLSFWTCCLLILSGMLPVTIFAPVRNVHKQLTKDECIKHKRTAIIVYSVLSFIGLLIFEMYAYHSRVLIYTLMSIVMLIIIEILMQRSGLHEG